MARQAPNILFSYQRLSLVQIVQELVDNSLDQSAKRVDIALYPLNDKKTEFGLLILDNGRGFSSPDHMFNSMEIESESVVRLADSIGTFHVGMKLAPIRMFPRCTLVTKFERDARAIDWSNPQFEPRLSYDMNTGENPTFPTLFDPRTYNWCEFTKRAFNNISKKFPDWKTAVVCHTRNVNVKLLEGTMTVKKQLNESSDFVDHLERALGQTYQHRLEDDHNLSINIHDSYTNSLRRVGPWDPFCSAQSPSSFEELASKLEAQASSNKKSIDRQKLLRIRNIGRFGTVIGPVYQSRFKPGFTLQCFIVPREETRTISEPIEREFRKSMKWTRSVPTKTRTKGGDELFKSTNMSGFFFYKNGRLLHFGEWWHLPATGNGWNKLRIKVILDHDFDPEQNLIQISPNKEEIHSISHHIWDEIIEGMSLWIGGPEYGPPFDVRKPMYIEGHNSAKAPKSKFYVTKSTHWKNLEHRGKENTGLTYAFCEACETMHVNNTKEKCPMVPCMVCKEVDSDCDLETCTYICPNCTMKGDHHRRDCPKPCQDCGVKHPQETCPVECLICESMECKCCKVCKKPNCSVCCLRCHSSECTCENERKGAPTLDQMGDTFVLRISKTDQRGLCVEKIRELLEKLNISRSDLFG